MKVRLFLMSLVDWDMRSDRNSKSEVKLLLASLVDWDMRSDRNSFYGLLSCA